MTFLQTDVSSPASIAEPKRNIVRVAATEFAMRVRSLGRKDKALNTGLKGFDVVNNFMLLGSALVDGNFVRALDAAISMGFAIVFVGAEQGVKPPAGKTPFKKWLNAVKHPDESTLYFTFCAPLPMAALGLAWNLKHGLTDRPPQLWQFAFGVAGTIVGCRSLYRKAVKDEAKQLHGIELRDGFIDRYLLHRHVTFAIGATVVGSKIVEALQLAASHQLIDGLCMLAPVGLGAILLVGNKIWQERQWRKEAVAITQPLPSNNERRTPALVYSAPPNLLHLQGMPSENPQKPALPARREIALPVVS